MGYQTGVFMVRDYDAGDTFGATVGVECVCCEVDGLAKVRRVAWFGSGVAPSRRGEREYGHCSSMSCL